MPLDHERDRADPTAFFPRDNGVRPFCASCFQLDEQHAKCCCILLKTIGPAIDGLKNTTPAQKEAVNRWFQVLETKKALANISTRMCMTIENLIDLRLNRWKKQSKAGHLKSIDKSVKEAVNKLPGLLQPAPEDQQQSLQCMHTELAALQVRALIEEHGGSIDMKHLPKLFQEKYGTKLDYRALGYEKLKDLIDGTDGVQRHQDSLDPLLWFVGLGSNVPGSKRLSEATPPSTSRGQQTRQPLRGQPIVREKIVVGQQIEAKFKAGSRTWKLATVVALQPEKNCYILKFDGYQDLQEGIPLDRIRTVDARPPPHESQQSVFQVGQAVEAQFTEKSKGWKPAKVVAVDPGANCYVLEFDGYDDWTEGIPKSRIRFPIRISRAEDPATAAAAPERIKSAENRALREQVAALQRKGSDAEAAAATEVMAAELKAAATERATAQKAAAEIAAAKAALQKATADSAAVEKAAAQKAEALERMLTVEREARQKDKQAAALAQQTQAAAQARAAEQKAATERVAAQKAAAAALAQQTQAAAQARAAEQKATAERVAAQKAAAAALAQQKQASVQAQQKQAAALVQQRQDSAKLQAKIDADAKLDRANASVKCANCDMYYRETDNTSVACVQPGPPVSENYHPQEWQVNTFKADKYPCCGNTGRGSKGCALRNVPGPPAKSRHHPAATSKPDVRVPTFTLQIRGSAYDVDLTAMTQTNRSTRFVRTIRRVAQSWEFEDGPRGSGDWEKYDPATSRKIDEAQHSVTMAPISGPGIQDPDPTFRQLWASTGKIGQDKDKMFPVQKGSSEHANIAGQITRTLSSATIVRIDRIENGPMRQAFAVQDATLEKQIGADFDAGSMRRRLFHGTQAVEAIVNSTDGHGFLPLLAGTAVGAVHGDGTYFARDASYSNSGYARRDPQSSGQKQMFLVDVLVGRSERGTSGMKMCSLIPGEQHMRYNSLVDKISNPSIFVVQHSNQAYPAYLITYRE